MGLIRWQSITCIILFMISAFAESLKSEWKVTGLSTSKFLRETTHSITRGKCQLLGHTLDINRCKDGHISEISHILYVNDGSFIFNLREDLIKGVNIISSMFKNLDMGIHIEKWQRLKNRMHVLPFNRIF